MTAPRVGRRGRVLLFFGGLDLIYAISLIAPDGEARDGALFTWLAGIAPLWAWAAAWALVGALCLWQAFRVHDQVGYTAAICLKVGWGVVCLGGWLAGEVNRGYVSAAIWLGAAALVGVIAGWPEVDDGKGPVWTRPS